MKRSVWIKVTPDKYELIEAIADTAEALAKLLGVKKNTIYSSVCHAKTKGIKTTYRKVVLDDD